MISHEKETKQAESKEFTRQEEEAAAGREETGGESGADKMSDEAEPETDTATAAPTPEEEAFLWKDKYMRLSAEFDNYRKRTLREKMELVDTGGADVIKTLLPVLDDMDRALDSMQRTEDVASVRSGIELIHAKLVDTLRQKGLAEIKSVGEKLDTDYHEAVAKIPAPDKKQKGYIVDVAQKGYTLKDKVVRHAKVVVGE
ncbi:MAG: nucleotide exchange factor GrpE [Rikenellaceae bacterium]|nr:nucleotide exchange factor GrpE [Rikenellaceae bacterium]